MDPIEIVKLRQQVRKRECFDTFILNCFIGLSCCLLISTPFWLPSLVSSIKAFIFVSVPSIGALLFTPKCLFIFCNIIIIILIGESKHVGSSSSTDNEIYHEYVKRSATIIHTQPQLEKQEVVVDAKLETVATIVEEKEVIVEEQENEVERKQVENVKQDEMVDTKSDITSSAELKENLIEEQGNQGGEIVKENGKEEEEEAGLPSEDLNKKFDDFIAKIRNQLRLEARQQVSQV